MPELRGRLRELTGDDGRAVLAAHSQGTVLGYAALAPLTTSDDRRHIGRIAVVTQGSPIRRLFVPFFPEYFSLDDLRVVAGACDPAGGWVNFYRETDYIGKHLFAVPAEAGALPGGASQPTDVRLRDPERPRFPPHRHTGYDREPLVQGWIASVVDGDGFSRAVPATEPGDDPTASRGT